MKNKQKYYPRQTLIAFLLVLFAMPLGHALMILMEKFMGEGAMHIAGFMMGFVGLILVIIGVFVKGDTQHVRCQIKVHFSDRIVPIINV